MPRKAVGTPKAKKTEIDFLEKPKGKNSIDLLTQIRLELKHKNEIQKVLTQSIRDNDVTICTGPAGTGKTYLSCVQALTELKINEKIRKIVLVKSVTTLKSEEIGFLKGTMEEKMEPFMYSFTGNFEKIIGKDLFAKLKNENYIEILPIAYLRGVNIDNAVVIIDEVQNISIDNIRTILTRLGENSKMVFLGDVKQIDAKNKFDSALSFLVNNFKNIRNIGIVEFSKLEIIRHPLVKVIEDVFDKIEEDNKAKKNEIKIKPQLLIENVEKPKEKSFFKKLF